MREIIIEVGALSLSQTRQTKFQISKSGLQTINIKEVTLKRARI
jgi:hypothetical protein